MGYDYSQEFLYRHPEDIKMVETCYKTRQKFYKVHDTPTEATRSRININNVLRSLAMYYPDQFLDVRKKVRTKIDRNTEGKWVLTVYTAAPNEAILGRPPGHDTRSTWLGSVYVPPLEGVTGDEYRYPNLVTNENAVEFVGKVLELPPEIKRAFIEFADEILNPVVFNDMFGEHGWVPHLNGPTTLILERP